MPSIFFFVYNYDSNYFKTNIRLIAGELLLDPNRVRYTQLHVDVEVLSLPLDHECEQTH